MSADETMCLSPGTRPTIECGEATRMTPSSAGTTAGKAKCPPADSGSHAPAHRLPSCPPCPSSGEPPFPSQSTPILSSQGPVQRGQARAIDTFLPVPSDLLYSRWGQMRSRWAGRLRHLEVKYVTHLRTCAPQHPASTWGQDRALGLSQSDHPSQPKETAKHSVFLTGPSLRNV